MLGSDFRVRCRDQIIGADVRVKCDIWNVRVRCRDQPSGSDVRIRFQSLMSGSDFKAIAPFFQGVDRHHHLDLWGRKLLLNWWEIEHSGYRWSQEPVHLKKWVREELPYSKLRSQKVCQTEVKANIKGHLFLRTFKSFNYLWMFYLIYDIIMERKLF